MGQQVESDVAALELERVEPDVPVLFERDTLFYSTIEKRPVEVISNRDMRVPLAIRPGGKFGHYNPDGGSLGRGSGAVYDKAVVNTVHFKFGVEWTKKADISTDEKRKAVQSAFREELAKAMAEFRRHVESICMTDGTGVLGTISNVSNAGGVDTYTLDSDGFGVKLLRYNQDINVYAADLLTNRTAGAEKAITFHDIENKQIKIPQVAGAIATDKVVISGVSATPPVSLYGVPYHHSNASTGTWLGMNRANFPEIRANRVNANGDFALPFPRLAMNKIGNRMGIENRKKCTAWTHPCQADAYERQGQAVHIINKEAKQQGLDLYYSDQMQMAGAPVKQTFSWNQKRIDFIVGEVWGRAQMEEPGFHKGRAGNRIFPLYDTTTGAVLAAEIFYITASFNFFVNNPGLCAYIDGLNVLSGY